MKKILFKAAPIFIGAAFMFVLMRYAAIPTGIAYTNINFGIPVFAVFSAVLGPIAGFLIGFIGHVIVDLTIGEGVWWSWVISSAFFGFIVGIFRKYLKIEENKFGIVQALLFNGVQVVANITAYVFIARILDLIIYNETFKKITIQGFAAAGINIAVVLVIGTLLAVIYSKTGIKIGDSQVSGKGKGFTKTVGQKFILAIFFVSVLLTLFITEMANMKMTNYEKTIIEITENHLKADNQSGISDEFILNQQRDARNMKIVQLIVVPVSILFSVLNMLLYRKKAKESDESRAQIEQYNKNLQKEVDRQTESIRNLQEAIVYSMSDLIDKKDGYTGGHTRRVSGYVAVMLRELARRGFPMTESEIKRAAESSLLHDMGKIAIPDNILLKNGKLTEEEFDVMKRHSSVGADSLQQSMQFAKDNTFLENAFHMAKHHHEKWNGCGYPDGKKEQEIPFLARVIAIADVYDALRSQRPYKAALDREETKSIILEGKGHQFDPEIVDVFLSVEPEFSKICESYGR